jgi:hypothetical protein
VGGRIVAGVSLGFDDPAADPVDKEVGPNQIAGDRYRIVREEGLGQRCLHSPISFGDRIRSSSKCPTRQLD